jgi:predicted nuclease of predicted toxin-antitoxin system
MRLLFDQHLAVSLVHRLALEFPNSAHVKSVGLLNAADETIWSYAAQHGFLIVSKDVDFLELSARLGPPPKVIRLSIGNCSTDEVEVTLRSAMRDIAGFRADESLGCLVLGT